MIKVYDDFLIKKDFDFITHNILGHQFPWHIGTVANPEKTSLLCDELDNIQFCESIYKDFSPQGPEFNIIKPIISSRILHVAAIRRIKANITLRTSKIVRHGWHTDGITDGEQPFVVAIYYVNSNDGYTQFRDGTKVESIANRLVIFPSTMEHTGTTCTNTKFRCVINFNFYSGHPLETLYGHTEGS
tara:strand:- start:97 stop:657 length:561 start_codon:yes stop_codon:yes gene_type:complete